MSGRRWDWHMNDTQKAVVRCLSADDRVSISTLCHRLGLQVTAVYMNGLKRRGLVEPVGPPSHHVYRLTSKGRRVAREARAEIDRTYGAVRCPTPMIESQRARAKAKRSQFLPPIESIVRMPPGELAKYLASDDEDEPQTTSRQG